MTDEQRLVMSGVDMLLGRFSWMPDDSLVEVSDIIKASNEIYREVLSRQTVDAQYDCFGQTFSP